MSKGRGGKPGNRQFTGGPPNMQQMMRKMQAQLETAQAELKAAQVQGSAGGGLVTATVTGDGELTAVTIDPKAVDPDDADGIETLQDLIVAAVRDAKRAADELAEQTMGPVTGGLGGLAGGLGLPGL